MEKRLASEIVKEKLIRNNEKVTVYSATGRDYLIIASYGGKTFQTKALPIKPPYEYTVFDIIVECLEINGGKAQKGNGRNFRMGDSKCDDSTVVGYIGKHYLGKNNGETTYDPVHVLAAILEWADIVHNGRGYLELKEYE